MYKIFLTLRYLTRKKIVVFPILVVWLCLMMMIIVTSIMGGFVDRVRQTNHELYGDIIIGSRASAGWEGYDDLQKALKARFPEIEASTSVIHAFALANVPDTRYAGATVPAELVGIDPVGRSQVSHYRQTLFKEYISPHQAADDLTSDDNRSLRAPRLPAIATELVDYAKKRYDAADKDENAAERVVATWDFAAKAELNYHWLWGLIPMGLLVTAWMLRPRRSRRGRRIVSGSILGAIAVAVVAAGVFWPLVFGRQYAQAEDRWEQAREARARADRTLHFALTLPEGRYASKDALLKIFLPAEPSFQVPPDAPLPPDASRQGCVVGSQMGFFPRDKRGNFQRADRPEFIRLLVTVFPASPKTGFVSSMGGITEPFTIVDDSYTGVYDIDLTAVYVPFETAQVMAGMRADPDIVKQDPSAAFPPRCSEVLIRLRDHFTGSATKEIRARVEKFVQEYRLAHQQFQPLVVQTWDERQAKYLGAVENEKVMQIFILGLMSLVVLVVIFLIFYMIVRDKTRDIGIIKAIGGSEEGVAGIFLTYGLFIGVVGGMLGAVSGVAFVTHTNQIHEWIYQMTGIVIWDRSVYLFDRIPDTVHLQEVAIYFILALLAGVVGALIPAIVAGTEDPVQAVRYE